MRNNGVKLTHDVCRSAQKIEFRDKNNLKKVVHTYSGATDPRATLRHGSRHPHLCRLLQEPAQGQSNQHYTLPLTKSSVTRTPACKTSGVHYMKYND